MQRFLFTTIFCVAFSCFAIAQKITYHPNGKPTKAEGEFDNTVRTCITDEYTTLQGENFSFLDWICTVQHYTKLMTDRMTSGFTVKIAEQQERALEVAKLAKSCAALKPVQKELSQIAEIYKEKVKTGEEENSDGKAKIDFDAAKDILNYTKKVLEKLKINRKITDIR